MKKGQSTAIAIPLATLSLLTAANAIASEATTTTSNLPVKWGELTAPDFVKAVQQSGGICLIPISVSACGN